MKPVGNIYLALCLCSLVLTITATMSGAQTRARTEIDIPDIPGFKTLKCDFHLHTVFSDGVVWPTVRIQEAWREGLDSLSITDHLEYQSHSTDVITDHNRPYQIAKPTAESLNLVLIKGSEITRSFPAGHYNVLFVTDSSPLAIEDWKAGIQRAVEQGAFVMWNHPGWSQPDEIPVWYDEQTEIYEKGWMHGMEIVNQYSYYPLAHQWCLDKGITMLGNSDTHDPIDMNIDRSKGEHRAMTLVFARERTQEGIRESLFAGRTAVYFRDLLIAKEEFLSPIFAKSIELVNSYLKLQGTGTTYLQIQNSTQIPLKLKAAEELEEVTFPAQVTLHPHATVVLGIQSKNEESSGVRDIVLPYTVENLLVAPGKGLSVEITFTAEFITEK